MNMFKGPDGSYSTTKITSFLGYITFIIMSIIIFFWNPDKFNYDTFAFLCAGSASAIKLSDKFMNNKFK